MNAAAIPNLPLLAATALLLIVAVEAKLGMCRPLWLCVLARIVAFALLTWLVQMSLVSPLRPDFDATSPTMQFWEELVEAGWWVVGARVAVGVARLFVVLENKPRETRILSDLLAGGIYISTILAIINFAFSVPVGGLVATSGVIAIVLGLALQSTLADVFSGVAVGLERPYKPGDLIWVEGGVEGRVLLINWRSTHIATGHNNVAIVPNSVIAKSRLENRSSPTPMRGDMVSVSLDPEIDPRRCLAALEAAIKACRLPLERPAPSVACVGLHGDGIAYEIWFAVAATEALPAARTEIITQIHRHLRHAGIRLAVSGLAELPPASVPMVAELLAQSDLFGLLTTEEQELLAGHFVRVSLEGGDTLLREGEMPDALFLIASGTAEITKRDGDGSRVVAKLSPGESLGMIGLITGTAYTMTATAVTPLAAYRLDKAGIAAVMRARPEMSLGLEALARRGQEWLRREAAAHEDPPSAQPEMFLARLRQFLHRLNG